MFIRKTADIDDQQLYKFLRSHPLKPCQIYAYHKALNEINVVTLNSLTGEIPSQGSTLKRLSLGEG